MGAKQLTESENLKPVAACACEAQIMAGRPLYVVELFFVSHPVGGERHKTCDIAGLILEAAMMDWDMLRIRFRAM